MLFNSLQFLVFFPVVTAVYFLVASQKQRVLFLLAASCYFYMCFIPKYILILALTIVVDYVAGIVIESRRGSVRKSVFVLSLVANLGILGFFKYFNFLNGNLHDLAAFLHWNYPIRNLEIILPIGLSFHTFQSMSYTVEVYRGNQKAERSFWTFALYVMFYPQLVAGPIERPQNLLRQFHEKKRFDYPRLISGLQLMTWGFFKKLVVADRLAVYVNEVYKTPASYHGLTLVVATVFFSIQIYCDFSGYSDIAIGSARVMGFDLMRNFNRPYFARSIKDFWSRWHISLSTWFKDYVYFPLGGNRTGPWRQKLNLFVVFLLSGIWHGASWNFVVWGLLHGVYQVVSVSVSKRLDPLRLCGRTVGGLQILMTFVLVTFAWIFFRADTLTNAWVIVSRCLTDTWLSHEQIVEAVLVTTGDSTAIAHFLFAWLAIVALLLTEWRSSLGNESTATPASGPHTELVWALGILAILFFGKFNSSSFIYFQF